MITQDTIRWQVRAVDDKLMPLEARVLLLAIDAANEGAMDYASRVTLWAGLKELSRLLGVPNLPASPEPASSGQQREAQASLAHG